MDKILLDCDDVLLSWTDGFRGFLKKYHNIEVSGVPQSWDLSQWINLDRETTLRLVKQFNEDTDDFGKLKPIKSSELFLSELYDLGFSLTVITSCSDNIRCINNRKDNLENVFGNIFDDIICLPLGVSKGDYLKKFEPSFWVEDNYHNCLLGKELGHNGVIIRHDHNKNFEKECTANLNWTEDWHEINDIISRENSLDISSSFKL